MKKISLSVFIIMLILPAVFSQGIYIRVGGTYGLPAATSVIGSQYSYTASTVQGVTTYSGSNKSIKTSFGTGPDFGFTIGYKFNQNFSFDLSGQYLIGNKYITSSINKYFTNNVETGADSSVYHLQAKAFMLNPSFEFAAGFGKAAPYGRFGVVFGIPQLNKSQSYSYYGYGSQKYDKSWVYKKGIALGYQAAVGMNWKLSEKIDIYTEVNFLSLTWYANHSDLKKYIQDGKDVLANQTVSQKQTDYVKSYDPNAQQDPAKPSIQPKEAYPFSSVSANVGLRYTLFQKKND